MRTRILSLIMSVLLLAALATTASAATYEALNQDEVFLKQEQRGTCTLASTAMMLRRAALLNGDENWAEITEASMPGHLLASRTGSALQLLLR